MDNQIRAHFPILQQKIHGQPLVYLDSAATTQKPRAVLDAMEYFYTHHNANVGRSIHKLSAQATNDYMQARIAVASFLHAKNEREIVFVRSATEAINLVAASYGGQNFTIDDEIVLSTMEHHSNIIPWQLISTRTGAKLRIIKIHENGELDLKHYASLLNKRTKMVAITHVSNTLGTINPIQNIIQLAHAHNVLVLVDGAQAVGRLPIDVKELDCDFYVFSAHKMYGPTGIGVLYGKEALLDAMPPYQGGGGMINRVSFAHTTYADLPEKFEAGTPNIAGAIGLKAAIEFIQTIGIRTIMQHEQQLLHYAATVLAAIPQLKIIGTAKDKVAIISWVLTDIHPHDVATVLDTTGIAIRAGHHCTMPLMEFYGIPGTSRMSCSIYNTQDEIDKLVVATEQVKKYLKK